jgi:HIP---CoA ligase
MDEAITDGDVSLVPTGTGGVGHPSIAALLESAAARFGPAEAVADVQDGGRRLSFAALREEAHTLAAALVAADVAPGDRVGLWAPNTWEWVVAALGVAAAGAVLVPINTRFRGEEAADVLDRSRSRLLLTVNGFLGVDYPAMLRSARRQLGDLDVVMLRGTAAGCPDLGAFTAGVTDAHRAEVVSRSAAVGPQDLAAIMFTSGTTGAPKGVMVRGGPWLAAFEPYATYLRIEPGHRMLVSSPYFHMFGLGGGIFACLLRGAANVPLAVWDPDRALALIEAERITTLAGAPAVFQGLLNRSDLDRFDLSSLRSAITGASTVPEETVVQMRSRLGLSTVITGYGMTETSGVATLSRPDDDPHVIATTSGCAIPGVEIRVVDDDGAEVAVGSPGEVLVRGFCVMAGYSEDPEATAEAIDADGWLHTGDIGVLNERGYLDITDRKKDMFIVGGFNAYPAEIERMMMEHEGIGQVAVIGVTDDRLGEVGAAFVVPAAGSSSPVDGPQLTEWCRQRMANYKAPRYIWFVDALPLNPSGKVLKADLRADAARRRAPQA